MTPIERVCVCGATYRIETDDIAWANRLLMKWDKIHNKCQVKPKESLTGHPRTKKGHIRRAA